MEDALQPLRAQLRELKLKHLAEQLDRYMLEVSCSDKPYAQLLQEFFALEIGHRRRIGMENRLRHANLPVFDKALDLGAYDFAKRSGVTKRQIVELTSNFLWIDQAYNILFLGSQGLGKSFLSSYIGYKAIEAGYKVLFISMTDLAHLLKTEPLLKRSRTKMKRIRNCDLLILDEVANTILDHQEGNLLFQLMVDFYQHASMIVTSNKGFDDWAKALGDTVVAAAVMDRLLHKCEIFNLGGDSWRMEDQQSILKNLLKGGAPHT